MPHARLIVDRLDGCNKLVSANDLRFHILRRIAVIEHRFRIGEHHEAAKLVVERAIGKQIERYAVVVATNRANQLQMAPVLRDGRINALSPASAQIANEIPLRIDLNVPVEVLAFDREVALAREHHEIDLRSEAVMLQEQVLQDHHVHMGVLQLVENAVLAGDARPHGALVGVEPGLRLGRKRAAQRFDRRELALRRTAFLHDDRLMFAE